MTHSVALQASCHCGNVNLTINSQPSFINECNCSLCRKHGAWWGYFQTAEVKIDGTTRGYTRSDRGDPAVEVHFCEECGCTTHWTPTRFLVKNHPDKADQLGLNMRLFEVSDLVGVELRFPDGLNISADGQFGFVRQSKVLPSE